MDTDWIALLGKGKVELEAHMLELKEVRSKTSKEVYESFTFIYLFSICYFFNYLLLNYIICLF